MLRRTFARLAFAALAFPLAACGGGGDSPTGPTTASVVGTWNLQSINGQALPYVLQQTGADKLEVTRETFTFSSTTFTQTTDYRLTQSGRVTTDSEADAGRYTINGNAVTVTFNSDGSSVTGTVSGNTITAAADGVALVYRRQ